MSRLRTLELRTEDLAERLDLLERRVEVAERRPEARAKAPADPVAHEGTGGKGWTSVATATARHVGRTPLPHPPAPTPPPAPALPPAGRPGLEDLLGGRILAWTGGVAVLAGIVLLVAVAVSRGWIGEDLRTFLGALTSFSLVAAGAWLQERRERTDAALAATAAGIAGLFAVVTVASRVYDLVPPTAGVALALGVGALGTALALRWKAQGIAALGLLGGLAAPAVLSAPADPGTAALLFAGAVCAAVVCVRARWDWLALGAFAVVTPQWVSGDITLLTLVAFGLLTATTAVALARRDTADDAAAAAEPGALAAGAAAALGGVTFDARAVPLVLLLANAFVLVPAGWETFADPTAWLAGLTAAHAALAAPLLLRRDPLGLAAATIAVACADLLLLTVLSGTALAAAWSATAVAFAVLAHRLRGATDELRAAVEIGLGVHVGLALIQALTPQPDLPTTPALAGFAIACFASGVVLHDRRGWRTALHGLGLATLTGLAALLLEGPALAVAWAGLATIVAELGRRLREPDARLAALVLLTLPAAYALESIAPPEALLDGLPETAGALIAFAVLAVAGWRTLGLPAPAGVALYAASTLLVTALGAGAGAQTALSALWGVTGVALLVIGLRTDRQAVRTTGFGLLGVALAKVVLHDLTELDAFARVGSMLGLGLLLLVGAYAWQRIRGGSVEAETPR